MNKGMLLNMKEQFYTQGLSDDSLASLPLLLPIFDKRMHRVPPLLPCLQDSVVALDR